MRRETIQLQVEQQIIYAHNQAVERYDHKTEAELLELESFARLSYQNQQQQTVKVRWVAPDEAEAYQVRIDQPQGILLFHPERETVTDYRTAQGVWPLTVVTQQIRWHYEPSASPGRIRHQLTVDYQLKNDQELLGNYRFRLIYVA